MMSKFTHGLMVVDVDTVLDSGEFDIEHFVGYWDDPTDNDIDHIREELDTDSEFGLVGQMHRMSVFRAPPDVIDYYNGIVEVD
jgi:hypothetical protein